MNSQRTTLAEILSAAARSTVSLQGISLLPNSVLMTMSWVITVVAFIVSSGIRSRKTRG